MLGIVGIDRRLSGLWIGGILALLMLTSGSVRAEPSGIATVVDPSWLSVGDVEQFGDVAAIKLEAVDQDSQRARFLVSGDRDAPTVWVAKGETFPRYPALKLLEAAERARVVRYGGPEMEPRAFRLLLVATLLVCACGDALAGLQWETRESEVREAAPGERVEAEFAFTNPGEREVKITSVRSNCDCTAAVADRQAYAPGASGKVTAGVAVGRDWRGTKTKQILVRTDDPDESAVLLTLKVIVAADPPSTQPATQPSPADRGAAQAVEPATPPVAATLPARASIEER